MLTYDHLSITEATLLQKDMASKISLASLDHPIRTIAGADISFNRFSPIVYAGIVVLSYPDLRLLSHSLVMAETHFPYVSGYLAFREAPAVQQAWDQLPEKPDLVVLDGQGITHPRRLGIASHFGVLNQQPSIGCAKSMLYGRYEEPEWKKLSSSPIYGRNNETLGYALRTKDRVKPVFVSPGHLINAKQSLEIIRKCVRGYRIPEPTRIAHEKVNLFRTGVLSAGYVEYPETDSIDS